MWKVQLKSIWDLIISCLLVVFKLAPGAATRSITRYKIKLTLISGEKLALQRDHGDYSYVV